jgi:hypothetical protein
MTPSDQLAINTWLDSSRNYDEGLKLLVKHSRNPAIGRMFEGREHRYANKLAYEISKLLLASGSLEKSSIPKPVKPVALIKPIPSAIDLQDALATDPNLPAILVRVIAEFSSKYKTLSMAHYALKAIAPDNRPESVEYRRNPIWWISWPEPSPKELGQWSPEGRNIIIPMGISTFCG